MGELASLCSRVMQLATQVTHGGEWCGKPQETFESGVIRDFERGRRSGGIQNAPRHRLIGNQP